MHSSGDNRHVPQNWAQGKKGNTANMANAIGRGLICGWVEPTKPLLHNNN